jgi:aldehyde:ferredoxin oxidoreductase
MSNKRPAGELRMAKTEKGYAYAGKILRINLGNGATAVKPTSAYAEQWLGAPGIAAKILYDELRSWVTPYEPANKLILGAGPLVGTTAPGACKSNMSTLGPVTGGWASSCSDSYTGGELKCAGYDSIVLEGRAHTPVYLWIRDDRIEIRDASHLWGKTTWETLDSVRAELRDPALHVLSIGPAGENLVRGACVIQDRGRAFGRCGIGTVMGSKNLKSIVVKGTGAVRVADPGRFMEAVKQAWKMVKGAKTLEGMQKYGTLSGLPRKQKTCGISYKNFQELCLPDDMVDEIDPCRTIEKYQVARQSFPGCAIGCGRHLHISEGPFAGLRTEACQMEVMNGLQCKLAIREPTFMFKANAYCNQLGLDVDAAGGSIAWAMECYQRGIIDEKDADGLKLKWGDGGVALEMIRKMAYREGFGDILAEGSAKAAGIIGRESGYYAMHIKGQDLYEPCRGAMAWCLGTTTSTRGGGHTTGAVNDARSGSDESEMQKARDVFGVEDPYNPLAYEGKARMVTYFESLHRANNSLGVCHMNTIHWDIQQIDLPQLAELYSAASGRETSVEDLKRITMRQINLEKAFNLRHTRFGREDDLPTPRDLSEPIPSGPLAGWKMDREKFDQMLDEYYDLHGWDRKTSFPTRETLVALGLESVAEDLEKIGKLG